MTSVGILVNPASGRGRGVAAGRSVQEALIARGVTATVIEGSSASDALAQCREAVQGGLDSLVACGGDGTVHLALQAVVGSSAALSILPHGTGNDIAACLGIARQDPVAAAERLLADKRRTVDVAHVVTDRGEQRWFLGVLSAGFDSMVNERANHMSFPPGQAKYVAAIVAELGVFKPVTYSISLDDNPTQIVDGMLVAIGNGTSYGGGMQVCPSAIVDDVNYRFWCWGRYRSRRSYGCFPGCFAVPTSHTQPLPNARPGGFPSPVPVRWPMPMGNASATCPSP